MFLAVLIAVVWFMNLPLLLQEKKGKGMKIISLVVAVATMASNFPNYSCITNLNKYKVTIRYVWA